MMSSLLKWLCWLGAPLLTAAATKNKKTLKPARGTKPSRNGRPRAKKPVQRPARVDAKKAPAPSKAKPTRGKAAAPQKGTAKTAPAAEAISAEALPKPEPPAGRAILLSPESGKYADSVNPKFRWLSVGGATRYEVFWSEDLNLSSGYSVISIATEAAVPVEKPLRVGATYYWRVRGGNEGGWGPWSSAGTFSVVEETGM